MYYRGLCVVALVTLQILAVNSLRDVDSGDALRLRGKSLLQFLGCKSSNQCPNGQFCNNQGTCQVQLGIGQTCSSNSWCASGYCDFTSPQVGSTGPRCANNPAQGCQTASNCGFGQFCNNQKQCQTQLPNGQTCSSNSWCMSGYCDFTSPQVGSTGPRCANNPVQGCQTNANCFSGQFCNNQHQCQTQLPNGQTCSSNSWCLSGYCDFTSPQVGSTGPRCATPPPPVVGCLSSANCLAGQFCNNQNQCQAQLPNGQYCAADSWCSSGYCDTTGPQVGSTGPRCASVPVGFPCTSSLNCPSGQFCNNLMQCEATLPNGQYCASSDWCSSGFCNTTGPQVASTGPLCASLQCQNSASCSPGQFCNGLNQCEAALPSGQYCLNNSWCMSGACFNSVCS